MVISRTSPLESIVLMFFFSKNTAIFNTLSCRMYFAAVGCKQTVSGCHADTAKIRISISFTPSSFFLKFADTVCKFYRLVVNFPIAESLATFSHYAPLVRHFFCDSFNRWNRDTKQVGQCCLVRCRLLFQPFKDFTFQSIF